MYDTEIYIDSIKDIKRLSKNKQEEICLLIKSSKDAKEIEKLKNTLIESNLKLVLKLVYKFIKTTSYEIDIADLISEGNIGLMQAIEKYNPNNEYEANFTSFAYPFITSNIIKAIKKFRLIKIPSTYFLYKNKIDEFTKEKGAELSDDEICEKLNIRKETLDQYKQFIYTKYTYVDEINDGEKEVYLKELTYNDNGGFEKIDAEELKNLMKKHLDKLPDKYKHVVVESYMKEDKISMSQIAKRFGQTKQNIDAIKNKAIERLKKSLLCDKTGINYLEYINRGFN